MSDIIIIPPIEDPDQGDYFIEIGCENGKDDDYEENIIPIKPVEEWPKPPESDVPEEGSSITVIHPTKKCHDHNVVLNVKDLSGLVEAAKQDIGELLTSLATKKELNDLSDRIPDDIASVQFVYRREHAIESMIEQEILNIKNLIGSIDISHLAKEATLIAKVAELKEALNSIDFTSIEQAIQDVEDVTAREATLIQGVGDIIKAVGNIDFTDLEKSIADVKNAVVNIDFSALAKEQTLLDKAEEIKQAVEDAKPEIDLSSVEAAIAEVKTMVTPAFTISIKGKNGTQTITLAAVVEQVENEGGETIEDGYLVTQGVIENGILTSNGEIVDGYLVL